jgi:hypothetical protein
LNSAILKKKTKISPISRESKYSLPYMAKIRGISEPLLRYHAPQNYITTKRKAFLGVLHVENNGLCS